MHLLFVTQEIGKIPSGVVTVLLELCRNWRTGDRITILTYKLHWAKDMLLTELSDRQGFKVHVLPLSLTSEISYKLNALEIHDLLKKAF